MAVVSRIFRDKRSVGPNPTTAECAVATVVRGGEVLVNLTTFGSEARKNHGTPSQSMQFTEEMAVQLCGYFAEAFGWPPARRDP
jgi:hypothetical protein